MEGGHDWSTATKRERIIKRMKCNDKWLLSSSEMNKVKDVI